MFLCWCFCVGVFVLVWWCFCVGVVMFLWWCFCGVLVVVFVWWCFCGGVFVVVFLWWCFCAGVVAVVFLWWCFCGGVVVFLWCGCGGVLVVVFLWRCFCGGVLVVVFLWWCTKYYSSTTKYYSVLQSTTPVLLRTTPVLLQYYSVLLQYYSVLQSTSPVLLRTTKYYSVLQSTTPVLLRITKYYSSTTPYYKVLLRTTKYYSSTTPYYKVLLQYYSERLQYYSVLQSTTPYYKVLLQYYSVLQSTTPVLLRTTKYYSSTTPILLCPTKYYSSTTPYYRALLRPLKRRQNDVLPVLLRTTPVLQKLPKRAFRARLPQLFTEKASKMIVSCEASSKFHRTSFQNERFARCFRQFSQKKLPKGSFRARLPPNFTEQASKTSVSRDASSKFHRTSFQNERFAPCFQQFSQKKLPKWSFRARLRPNFIEQCFQNECFARCFRQFSPKICVSLQFRVIDTPIPARGFIRQKQNVPRTTTPCIPKCDNVRFASAPCAKMYESIHREPTRFAHTKMWGFTTVLGDRHHVFTERVHREQMKFVFRYSFGRSTPRFYREGWPRENEICVSLQFWAIDTTFFVRRLTDGKWNLRFATVLGDRHHVFCERVDRRQMKFAFRYSFGRSTPRFYRDCWPRENEICVSLQFWAIDTTFLARGLLSGWPSPSRPAE